jgi:oxazoline/thiazoline synthase
LTPTRREHYPTLSTNDVFDDIELCKAIVRDLRMEMLVVDQTRPDIGMPVVKVVVPGMRHFWPRFAPGRLYDVPVKLGWSTKPLSEEQLNPVRMFF